MYYWPFHRRLINLLNKVDIKALFDCHSLNGTGPQEAPDPGKRRKDIILGNNGDASGKMDPARGSTTCPTETLYLISEAFEGAGFSVALNDPYPGGFITAYHGGTLARTKKIAVQIEINQDLFLDRTGKRCSPKRQKGVADRVLRAFQEIAEKL
jgi:N-formylglutamate amidohydrolase